MENNERAPYKWSRYELKNGILLKNGLHTNGACPFFRNLCPIAVHIPHTLFFAVLDSRSRTAQAQIIAIYLWLYHDRVKSLSFSASGKEKKSVDC
jgi:hypothetical protein